MKMAREDPEVALSEGSTDENKDNISAKKLARLYQRYGGTRKGRQELNGEVLDDNPNALWLRSWLDEHRVNKAPELVEVVTAVDPNATADAESSAAGIVTIGMTAGTPTQPPHFYVLDDATVEQARPEQWGRAAVTNFHKFGCNRIVAERNNGGDMVAATIKVIEEVPVQLVWASRGKHTRAEPISALSEQGRLHMVGCFPELEDELCEWCPGDGQDSPNRLDAMVWGASALITPRREEPQVVHYNALEKYGGITSWDD